MSLRTPCVFLAFLCEEKVAVNIQMITLNEISCGLAFFAVSALLLKEGQRPLVEKLVKNIERNGKREYRYYGNGLS